MTLKSDTKKASLKIQHDEVNGMFKYHVKKSKRSRYTYRVAALGIILVCGTQLTMFFMGYGRAHRLGTFIALAFAVYGIFLFCSSFRNNAYDMDFEFHPYKFIVHTKHGDKTYTYNQITDISHVVPENEMLYSIIHISIGKQSYLIPFSYKKELADQIYTFLNERITSQQIIVDNKMNDSDIINKDAAEEVSPDSISSDDSNLDDDSKPEK